LMWAAVEATTLSSAFLVGIYGQRSSLEAAWKYIIICSVGVAFGLFGTILVYANAVNVMPDPEMAIFWTEVLKYTDLLDPTLMHLAFVFVLIGFGTKTVYSQCTHGCRMRTVKHQAQRRRCCLRCC
ncbi:hypothetical protein ABN09_15520, partial [Morganella morganii]